MRHLTNLRILAKLSLLLFMLIAISLSVSTISYYSLTKQDESAQWTDHTHTVISALDAVMASMVDQETGMRGYVLSADTNFLEPQKAGAAAYKTNFDQLRELTSDNAEQQVRLDELDEAVSAWQQAVVIPELRLMKDPMTHERARQIEITGAGKMSMDAIRAKVKEMIEVENVLLDQRMAEATAGSASARFSNIVGGFVIIGFSMFTLMLLHIAIVRPVVGMNSAMRSLAEGDTTVDVPGRGRKDEIGQMAKAVEVFRQAAITNKQLEAEAVANREKAEAESARLTAQAEAAAQARLNEATAGLAAGLKRLAAGDLSFKLTEPFAADFEPLRHDLNGAVEQLGRTLNAVARATTAIDGGSQEISRGADDLSVRTEQQAASLEETAAALDEITANVSNSSGRADEARAVAVQANASASESGEVVSKAVDAMGKIETSSNEVSNIIGVIDEIAFQTNLLALNAGVEAARAGEAGKGFAVVAQEVRELAQRSAKAAKEIKELIRNSSLEVQNGVKLVSDTGRALKTIEGYIVTINDHMDSIATSAREQSVGLGEVNTAVNQMDQVTQRNAAMVQETSAAGATLAQESTKLREIIGQFVLDGQGAQRPLQTQTVPAHQPAAAMSAATAAHAPVASPARKMAGQVATAFAGKAAVTESWEEF
jgi:methyl-accepting chemotaxis protein